jgi:hypothetical protein
MLSDDEETLPVIALGTNGHAPPVTKAPPVVTPRAVVAPLSVVAPLPTVIPRPTLTLKRPPFSRPAGALTISEMIERITKDVRRTSSNEIEGRHAELRAEIAAEVKAATGLGLAALVMNALAIVAVVVELAFSRGIPPRGAALALAAITAVFVAALRLGTRRAPATPDRPSPR